MHWNTADTLLAESLKTLMQAEELKNFRLVGGTALALHLGHRMSVDIDLFTDAMYGSIDFEVIEDYLKKTFPFVHGNFGGLTGMGKSYLIGPDKDHLIKLDIFYSNDPFFQPLVDEDGMRMATVEEIIAMKVDIVMRTGRKKDFWDLHETLEAYTIADMVALHKARFEWTHDPVLILENFTDFEQADEDLDPICLRNKEWIFVKEDIEEAVNDERSKDKKL